MNLIKNGKTGNIIIFVPSRVIIRTRFSLGVGQKHVEPLILNKNVKFHNICFVFPWKLSLLSQVFREREMSFSNDWELCP